MYVQFFFFFYILSLSFRGRGRRVAQREEFISTGSFPKCLQLTAEWSQLQEPGSQSQSSTENGRKLPVEACTCYLPACTLAGSWSGERSQDCNAAESLCQMSNPSLHLNRAFSSCFLPSGCCNSNAQSEQYAWELPILPSVAVFICVIPLPLKGG